MILAFNQHCRFALVLLCLVVVGCEQQAIADLKEYQKRLANVLDVEFVWSTPDTTLSYPAIHQLKADVPEANINLRDFYALQQCPVGTLIAERNTALGKIQLPSTRYHYEVQLLQGLEQCLTLIEEQNLKSQLTNWLSQKHAALPLVWANLIQTSSETRQAFSSNQGFLESDASSELGEFTRALHYLIFLPSNAKVDLLELEDKLNSLRQIEYIARLWKTQILLSVELTNATALLAQHSADIHCATSAEKQQVGYLRNVFQKFFIERIQPLAGMVDKSNYALKPIFDELLASTAIHNLFKQMIKQNLQHFSQYKTALRNHVVLWQDLLKRCDMSP